MQRTLTLALAVYLLLSFGAETSRASDEAAVMRLQAEQLAAEERCEQALPMLRRVRSLDPADGRAALLEGECAIRVRRYGEALVPLEEARRLDPSLPEVTLYLGVANYFQGDLDAAERELSEAARLLPESAEAQLYLGLVLLERTRAEEAALVLERAADLDPQTVDPAASYYAGRAWQIAKRRDRAEQELRGVMVGAPGTPWATEARRALEGAQQRNRRNRPWMSLTAGMEYDSNVVLRGTGVLLPDQISDEADARGAWRLRGGGDFFRNADWAMGARSDYYGSAQVDLREFDLQFPTFTLWVDRALGDKTFLRLQPDVGYAWVGYESYLLTTGVNLELHRVWGRPGSGRFFFRYQYRDYLFRTLGSDAQLDRDGNLYSGGYDHRYPLGQKTVLRSGLTGGYYGAHGTEYTSNGLGAWIGGRRSLPVQLALDLRFDYVYQQYKNPSVFSPSGSKRRDKVFIVRTELERPIRENVKVSARYRYENDDSNVNVYNYDRHVVGAYLTVDWGRR
jgi:Flp pilus assembly protein TadD